MAGSVEGLPTIEFSAWLTRDSNIDGAICDGGGRGVPARDWGDADLFDAVPEDGLRCPGGGVPFSDLAAEWLFADPLGESNRLCGRSELDSGNHEATDMTDFLLSWLTRIFHTVPTFNNIRFQADWSCPTMKLEEQTACIAEDRSTFIPSP